MDDFLIQATIYLVAIVIAVPLATRTGLGSVLGYLCAGLIIGPILGLAGNNVTGLQHVGEFGVVMMLFLIGLELEPSALWAMRNKLLGMGGAQVVGTTAAITVILLFFNLDFTTALAIGMIGSLSSTAIVLQTMSEKQLLQTEGGRSAFSVLLTQDLAVIPMLAILPFLAMRDGAITAPAEEPHHAAAAFIDHLPHWGVTLVTLAAVVLVVLIGHYLVRPLFKYVHAAKLREINTAMALVLVVGIASLMNLVGLSPALGTFLGGVVLANSEFRHELEADIEPFKGLLMGLFFITVGAGIQFETIWQQPLQIASLVFLLVAIKMAILWIIATIFKLRGADRMLFTLGLAQAGEFGFVLVSFAVGQNILPDHIAEQVLVVVALSMLITPLLFILHGKLSKRMRRTVNRPADIIDEQQPVIVAGIGRFGQVVNRMVSMSGFATTVLDRDLETIQLIREFGFKAYYGDPTRPDLLAAAGIRTAKVLVVCLDDRAAAIQLVRYARQIRPDLHIVAQARDREHVFELFQAGANDIVREMFDSSVRAGRYVLENVGLTPFEASELSKLYFKLDRASLKELAPFWKPGVPTAKNPEYIAKARSMNTDLEAAMMERFAQKDADNDEVK